MADPLEVREGETGLVRVFAIDVAPTEAQEWQETEARDWPLPRALGVERLGAEDVQVFPARDVAGIGLSGFLEAGHGIGAAQLAPDRERLDGETGVIAVIRSAAVDAPATLRPVAPVRLVGVYSEPSAPIPVGELGEYESARPGSGEAAPVAAEDDAEGAAREVFRPDRGRYIRDHVLLAAIGAVGATVVLWSIGNESWWVGAVAALLAVGVRGAYLASEELGQHWALTDAGMRAITAEGVPARSVALGEIAKVRRIGSAVQIVTRGGDKMLLKYMADPPAVRDRIARAAGLAE